MADVYCRIIATNPTESSVATHRYAVSESTTISSVVADLRSNLPRSGNFDVQVFETVSIGGKSLELAIKNPESFVLRKDTSYVVNFIETEPASCQPISLSKTDNEEMDKIDQKPVLPLPGVPELPTSSFTPTMTFTPVSLTEDIIACIQKIADEDNTTPGVGLIDRLFSKLADFINKLYTEISSLSAPEGIEPILASFFNTPRSKTALTILAKPEMYSHNLKVLKSAEIAMLKALGSYLDTVFPDFSSRPSDHRDLGRAMHAWIGHDFFIDVTHGRQSRLSNILRNRLQRVRKTTGRIGFRIHKRFSMPTEAPMTLEDAVERIGSEDDLERLRLLFKETASLRLKWLDELRRVNEYTLFPEFIKKFPRISLDASFLDEDYYLTMRKQHVSGGHVSFGNMVDGILALALTNGINVDYCDMPGDKREYSAATALFSLVRKFYGARGCCESGALFFGGKNFTTLEEVRELKAQSRITAPAILVVDESPDFKYYLGVGYDTIAVQGGFSTALHYFFVVCFVFSLKYSPLAAPVLHFLETTCGLRKPGTCATKLYRNIFPGIGQ